MDVIGVHLSGEGEVRLTFDDGDSTVLVDRDLISRSSVLSDMIASLGETTELQTPAGYLSAWLKLVSTDGYSPDSADSAESLLFSMQVCDAN
jgi:hypothetical protein